ncbi:hypothetical protein NQ317_002121 [Molorchus minor]|uniref:Translational activator of cytochrome c oxidase 1 n=1 Tax=Molorchus minor TaxID=1323400 RepID=A0ABQ9JV46_9CUCU|nr:hypothetical protein NQ317_002121 [Molorchus minor]
MLKNIPKILVQLSENHLRNGQVLKRCAGHSKWQNIRHIKGAKDMERSQIFTKLGRQIKVAVQEGGSVDPKLNTKLEQVIGQAKRVNMPAATLQSILKSCQDDKSQAKSHILDIKGPGSCFIICEVFTSHLHQLRMSMATILRKHQSKFADGSGMHLFQEKGFIEAVPPEGAPIREEELLEKATEDAIETGAEDVKIIEENLVQFLCGKSNLKHLVEGLENVNYQVRSASVEYIPVKVQSLSDSDLELCKSLYEKLENLPEVVRLSDNIA